MKLRMTVTKFIFFIHFVFIFHIYSFSQRVIHVLKIMDTKNENYIIRDGCRSISAKIDKEVKLLADKLFIYNTYPYDVTGDNFNNEYLLDVIENQMSYLHRDIVIIVYVGHGIRDEGQVDLMPLLVFDNREKETNILFSAIQDTILAKNPSVLLSIIIACNNVRYDKNTAPVYKTSNPPPSTTSLIDTTRRLSYRYNEIFGCDDKYTHVIDLISAKPGEYTNISQNGGIFFNVIFDVLGEALSSQKFTSWDAICHSIESETLKKSKLGSNIENPLCSEGYRMKTVIIPSKTRNTHVIKSSCKFKIKALKKIQHKALNDLRKAHYLYCIDAIKSKTSISDLKLLAEKQNVELLEMKLKHKQEIQRLNNECND